MVRLCGIQKVEPLLPVRMLSRPTQRSVMDCPTHPDYDVNPCWILPQGYGVSDQQVPLARRSELIPVSAACPVTVSPWSLPRYALRL
jgi:hypothetical protein